MPPPPATGVPSGPLLADPAYGAALQAAVRTSHLSGAAAAAAADALLGIAGLGLGGVGGGR